MGTPTSIQIGGFVERRVSVELCRAIEVAVVRLDYGSNEGFTPETPADLRTAVDEASGVLKLYDDDAPHGSFPDLERLLVAEGIAFDRASDAEGAESGEVVRYRPGMTQPRRFEGNNAHEVVVSERALRAIAEELSSTCAARRERARVLLVEAIGADIAPLTAFAVLSDEDSRP